MVRRHVMQRVGHFQKSATRQASSCEMKRNLASGGFWADVIPLARLCSTFTGAVVCRAVQAQRLGDRLASRGALADFAWGPPEKNLHEQKEREQVPIRPFPVTAEDWR